MICIVVISKRMFRNAVRQMQILYKLSGGQSFFARAEIKEMMSYLRLIINPEDDSAFLRIIIHRNVQLVPSP